MEAHPGQHRDLTAAADESERLETELEACRGSNTTLHRRLVECETALVLCHELLAARPAGRRPPRSAALAAVKKALSFA